MTPTEMAKRLGCTAVTINHWIKSGVILAYRVNGRYYITEEAFKKFLEGHQVGRVFDENR